MFCILNFAAYFKDKNKQYTLHFGHLYKYSHEYIRKRHEYLRKKFGDGMYSGELREAFFKIKIERFVLQNTA